jgi:hypothetical protein
MRESIVFGPWSSVNLAEVLPTAARRYLLLFSEQNNLRSVSLCALTAVTVTIKRWTVFAILSSSRILFFPLGVCMHLYVMAP